MQNPFSCLKRFLTRSGDVGSGGNWISRFFGDAENMTDTQALSISSVFACIRVLSETVASLPLKFYQRQPDGNRGRGTAGDA